jgi:hypothetical protein
VGSLIDELTRREVAARAEADRLRCRVEELAEELPRAEEQVSRLAIARGKSRGSWKNPRGKPRPASPIEAVTVPPWQEGAGALVLRQSYRDLLEVAADAGRPLRAVSSRPRLGCLRTRRRWRACGRS